MLYSALRYLIYRSGAEWSVAAYSGIGVNLAGLISSAIACHSVRSPMVCQGCARFRKRFICPPVVLQRISIVECTQRVFDSRPGSNDPVCNARLKKREPFPMAEQQLRTMCRCGTVRMRRAISYHFLPRLLRHVFSLSFPRCAQLAKNRIGVSSK